MPPTPEETTARVNRRAAEAAALKIRQVSELEFAKFQGITPGGLAIWHMPEGYAKTPRPTVHKDIPEAYKEFPQLWPNPAIDYPWKPSHSEGAGKQGVLNVQPKTHCDYVVILRTLERFPEGIRNVPSAANILYEAMWPRKVTSIQLGNRIAELVDLGLLNEYKVTPQARRRKGITLRKEAFALLRSGIIPELPPKPVEEETAGEESGMALAEEPQGEAAVGSLPPVAAPPAEEPIVEVEPMPVIERRDVGETPDFYAIGVGVLEAHGQALMRIQELERLLEAAENAHIKLQLEESQRQVKKLTERLQKTEEVANRYLRERDDARAEAVSATRNLEETLKSVRESPLSAAGNLALDSTRRMMERRPAPGPKSAN